MFLMWAWEQYFFVQDELTFFQRKPGHKGSVQIVAQANQSQNHKMHLPILMKEVLLDMVKFYLSVAKQAERSPKKNEIFRNLFQIEQPKNLIWDEIRLQSWFLEPHTGSAQSILSTISQLTMAKHAHHSPKKLNFFRNVWRSSSQKKPDLAWTQSAKLL